MSRTVIVELSMSQALACERAVAAAERHHAEPWRGLFGEVREVLEDAIALERELAGSMPCQECAAGKVQ